jgi:hypothetical protein
MAFAVFRCGSFEAQTSSHPVRAASASGALAAPTAPATPERAAQQRPGLSIAPWRELVAVRWDGISSVTLTLWCLPREAPAPAIVSAAARGAAGAGAGAAPAGAAAPVCIGTASFTLHGLSPGLPERITVPLLTRIRVRVPVLPAPAPPAARPAAAAAAAAAAIAEVAEDGEEDGDGDGGPAGEAEEGEEEDDGEDGEDEDEDEGGAAMRTGFAPTGAQLSVSLVAAAPLFVDECVEIAAGTLTFEAFYWPRK